LAAVLLPAMTAGLTAARDQLALVDDVLLYLLAVLAITVVGGFWPAVTAAVASSLLINWYFTPPLHTFEIERAANLLALLLFVVIAVAISRLVHAAALAAQAESLVAANQMRTALLAAVGHDLRTPLASVKAAVSSLRQDDVEWSQADRADLLETIEEGADRLGALIANLLDMSRIHSGSVAPRVRPTALHDITPGLLRDVLDPGATLQLDVPADLPLVNTDPGLLERALANLVANAVRYSPPGRPATLSAVASDATVVIRVVDHGPGVPADDRERIFAPFQQIGDRHTGAGVGLGLAVARGFVEALGGRLNAAETPGGGLTMRVELPMAPATRMRAGAVP
jgi:two-component system sensor histidine kinase KdpD